MPTVKITYLDDYINKEGKAAIALRIRIKGKKKRQSTGISIEPKYWDIKNIKVKRSHPESEEYNLVIYNLLADVNAIFTKYKLAKLELTMDLFEKEFSNKSDSYNFKKWVFDEINARYRSGEISFETFKTHKSVIGKFFTFKKDADFFDLTPDTLADYEKYMKRKLGNSQNTVHAALKTLKTYTIESSKKFKFDNPFKNYKLTKEKKSIVFFTAEEIELLFNYYKKLFEHNLAINHTKVKVLRAFLFATHTGLRISDLMSMKKEHIHKFGGVEYLSINEGKKVNSQANSQYYIKLSKTAKRLINEANPFLVKGFVFNDMAKPTMNKLIKIISIEAGIDKEKAKQITIHKARHTFATMALQHGTLKDVQELLNHSNLRSTEIYLHALPGNKDRIIDKFDDI